MCRGARHAAALRDREKYMQVPQSDAAPDLILAIQSFYHASKISNELPLFNLKVYFVQKAVKQMRSRRHGFFAFWWAAALVALAVARAGAWPERPVKIVIAAGAGGNNDVIARIMAPELSLAFGQPFVAENRAGASGAIGTEFVARSAPDGYTLLMASQSQIVIAPAVTKTSYDPARDFIPITDIGNNPFVLVVRRDLPVNTLAEFVAYVRAHPKKLSYVATGVGSINHLTMALLLNRAGGDMAPVFYKGGPGGLMDVIAGHVDAYLASLSFVVPHAATGELRLLAVTSDHRLPQLPQVPTFAEAGFTGLQRQSWNGLLAPAGTPREIVDRIAGETAKLVRRPDVAQRLASVGVDAVGSRPEELAAAIADDIVFWREAVRISGVAAQEK
jgi:tripartite-type tricarboxylate transporter receptor subunit TctC